jgi:hypothetical protein
MFRYICKNHLFASFATYLLQIFVQIRIQIFDLMQKILVAANIRFRVNIVNIRLRFSRTGTYLLQNIRLEPNIRNTLS